MSVVSSSLNPSARQFRPSVPPLTPDPLQANARKPRQTQILNNFCPEKAEIESLKIELGYAHTKIVDIQSEKKDLEETVKIYSQKIKLLENTRKDSLHEKYLSPSSEISSSSHDCPCQIKAKISKNSMNVKNLELKLVQELENITRRLDIICTQPPPPNIQVPRTSTTPPKTQTPLNNEGSHSSYPSSHFPDHDSSVQHVQEDLPVSMSLFTFEEDFANNDEESVQHSINPIHDISASDHESSFSFSDSFLPPAVSPELHLN